MTGLGPQLEVQNELRKLKRATRLRQAEVVSVDPIQITLGGSDVVLSGALVLNGETLEVGDIVPVLAADGNLLVLGSYSQPDVYDPPGFGVGIAAHYVASETSKAAATAFRREIVGVWLTTLGTATGIGYWVGTNSIGQARASLHDSAGTLLRSSNAASQPTADTFHLLPLQTPYELLRPSDLGLYFLCVKFANTAATLIAGRGQLPATQFDGDADLNAPATITPPTTPHKTAIYASLVME